MSDLETLLVPAPREIRINGGFLEYQNREIETEINCEHLSPESYTLTINSAGISVQAGDAAGVFYAKKTLSQLIAIYSGRIPFLEISDVPRFIERGYMLDISRCRIPKMETFFELVDLLADFKYNQLQLYTEHSFAYKGHETVWKDSSPMTPEEIQQLDAYCRERFIELVPNQNSLGHFERWLKHPEYHKYAECPEGFKHPISGVFKESGSTLSVSKESAEFVFDLYDQLLCNFSSDKFNIGCDEPWELGLGKSLHAFPKTRPSDLFSDWLKAMCQKADNLQRTPYFWADFPLKYPEKLDGIPKKSRAILWGYEIDHPFDEECARLKSAKIDFVVSPGDSTWNSMTGRWHVASQNILKAAEAADRWDARGLLLTQWGDQGHAQSWFSHLPALILNGALSWNPQHQDLELAAALDRFVFKIPSVGLGAWICRIGTIDARLKSSQFNRSLLFGLVRESPFPGDFELAKELISSENLVAEIGYLEDSLREMEASGEHGDSIEEILKECLLYLDILSLAARRLGSAAPVAGENIVDRFRGNWLKRFRLGGLDESVSGFLS